MALTDETQKGRACFSKHKVSRGKKKVRADSLAIGLSWSTYGYEHLVLCTEIGAVARRSRVARLKMAGGGRAQPGRTCPVFRTISELSHRLVDIVGGRARA